MARRDSSTSAPPEVEHSRLELEHHEARKTTVQNELLDIAESKKRLESSYEDTKTQLETELAEKRQAHNVAISQMAAVESAAKIRKETAEHEAHEAQVALDALKKEIAILTSQFAQLKVDIQNGGATILRLSKERAAIEKSLSDLLVEAKTFEQKKAAFAGELAALEAKIGDYKKEYSDLSAEVASYHSDIDALSNKKEQLVKQIAILSSDHSGLEKKISDARLALTEVQNQSLEHEREMKKREAEISEKAGNLSRLEVSTNELLQKLKEAKEEFTSEHLRRMGIRI